MTRPLGWLPPERYGRAHAGVRTALAPVDVLPRHVHLAAPATVYDQQHVGSCVAQSLACAVETLAPRAGYAPERPDRTALYYRARLATVESTLRDRASDAQAIQDLRGDLRELAALVRAEQPTTRDALTEIRARLARMEDRAASVSTPPHR